MTGASRDATLPVMRSLWIALAVALSMVFVGVARADIVDQLDKPASEVVCAQWWNGSAPKMANFRGKVVLLHFANPEKLTSKAFVANIRKLHKKYGEKGLVVIEVLLVDDLPTAKSYVASQSIKWLVGADTEHKARGNYLGTSQPRSYLIAPDGKIVFHAHVGALSNSIVEGQLARLPFFDLKSVPAKAKALAKATAAQRYAAAMKEVEKIKKDPYADDETRRLAKVAEADMERDHKFQLKLLDENITVRDWGVAWDRFEVLIKRYKGTPYHDEFVKRHIEMKNSERAVWVRAKQIELDKMLEKSNSRKKSVIEKLVRRLKAFAEFVGEARPGKKALEWVKMLEKRLSKMR